MPLDSIGRKFGTDKSSLHHNYLSTYESYLHFFRDKPIKLLEIGFGGYNNPNEGGESLYTWQEYFPNADITCLEIYPKDFSLDRVRVIQGSQDSSVDLRSIGAKYGPFDIIIDDGSHMSAHQIKSFTVLFSTYLRNGGIYIVEDTSTSYEPELRGFCSAIDFFKSCIDHYNYNSHKFQSYKMSPFTFIHFYNQLIIMQKGMTDII